MICGGLFAPVHAVHAVLLRSNLLRRTLTSTSSLHHSGPSGPSVCIVGSGPAGFYTAQQLLRGPPGLSVDVLERLPVPFGLVRFGVAPDHPEVKNVDSTFTKVAKNPRVRFRGNIAVGDAKNGVTVEELRNMYDVVVLAYGAARDREMEIPGESLSGVFSARKFVDFYNGLPSSSSNFNVDLSTHDTAVVVGLGNVALDVARILLTPMDKLRATDITEEALAVLAESKVRRVHVVGRRGPLHVAFTIKELREMVNLEGCTPKFNAADFAGVKEAVPKLVRPRKRLTELLAKTALDPPTEKQKKLWAEGDKEWTLKLLRTPEQVLGEKAMTGLKVGINRLVGEPVSESQSIESTGESETLPAGFLFRSIGYKSTRVDPSVPFDERAGIVPNDGGRVAGVKGMYVAGWLATGPRGVIVDTMTDAHRVGQVILDDIGAADTQKEGGEALTALLRERGVREVSFQEWERIDALEVKAGEKVGKPREKITDVKQFLKVLD